MKRQLSINLLASIIAFIVNLGINFLVTPYITNSIGVEAYGFVSLGASFINYVSLITISLNSMAGRFITIEIYRNNWKQANIYFSTVFYSNIILAFFIAIPSIIFIIFIDKLINIPVNIISDVRLLFICLFINFFGSIIFTVFSISTFATNKLYLKSIRDIESKIIQVIILLLLFICFRPAVSYLGLASLVLVVYTSIFNVLYMKRFLANIKISKVYFRVKAVCELISSGIWNTVIQVGQILLQGMDLLFANVFIGATTMGTLALAKTVPTAILSFVGVVISVFMPDFTILYAQNEINEFVSTLKKSMKLLGIVTNLPIAILVSYGRTFFSLWVPSQDPNVLQVLSIITVALLVVSGPINSIYAIFTVTNKVKTNALVLLFTGVINIAVVLIILKLTSFGIYAIAGVSTVLGILRNCLVTVPLGAKYIGLKWNSFLPLIMKSTLTFLLIVTIGCFFNLLFKINTWASLIAFATITVVIGLIINIYIVLEKSDRVIIYTKVSKLYKR